jgi:hypothetical protein
MRLFDDSNILDLGDVLGFLQQGKLLGSGGLRNIEVELDQETLDLDGNQEVCAKIRELCNEQGIRFSLGLLSCDV